MVAIEKVVEGVAFSRERLLDAQEIEAVASSLTRPTARMQLESLAKKLRKEAAALKVVEESHANSGEPLQSTTSSAPASTPVPSPTPVPAPTAKAVSPPVASSSAVKYTGIDKFAFDAGGSNDRFVTLYISLPGVGEISKDQINCDFQKAAFDLIVRDLRGKSYRLLKDHLEKDIDVEKSKYIVKSDKIIIKLAKVKGEYGSYDYWSKLSDPKRKDKDKKSKSNPSASITDLMKEMYDSGDDQMRKIIGESMLKQREGKTDDLMGGKDMGLGDLGAGFED